jgi:hypothetical protein
VKKNLARVALAVWLLVAPLVLCRLWLTHPDHFPRLPERFWIWLIEETGSSDGETLADLELLVILTLCIGLVAALTAAVAWLGSRKR